MSRESTITQPEFDVTLTADTTSVQGQRVKGEGHIANAHQSNVAQSCYSVIGELINFGHGRSNASRVMIDSRPNDRRGVLSRRNSDPCSIRSSGNQSFNMRECSKAVT